AVGEAGRGHTHAVGGAGGQRHDRLVPVVGDTVVVPASVRTDRVVTSGPLSGSGTVIRNWPRSTGSGRSTSSHSPNADPAPPERQFVSGSSSTAAATE